jgi:predicted alternative tryptophan synthase beta-subunit
VGPVNLNGLTVKAAALGKQHTCIIASDSKYIPLALAVYYVIAYTDTLLVLVLVDTVSMYTLKVVSIAQCMYVDVLRDTSYSSLISCLVTLLLLYSHIQSCRDCEVLG